MMTGVWKVLSRWKALFTSPHVFCCPQMLVRNLLSWDKTPGDVASRFVEGIPNKHSQVGSKTARGTITCNTTVTPQTTSKKHKTLHDSQWISGLIMRPPPHFTSLSLFNLFESVNTWKDVGSDLEPGFPTGHRTQYWWKCANESGKRKRYDLAFQPCQTKCLIKF